MGAQSESLSRVFRRNSIQRGWRANRLHAETLEDRRVLTTFFVDGAAADGGDGSAGDPFNTIQAAIDAAAAAAGADAVAVSPGLYVEDLLIVDPDDLTILGNGSKVASAGSADHTIDISNSANIAMHNLTITGASEDGVQARDSASLTLTHVRLSGNGDEGLEADAVLDVTLNHMHVASNDGRGVQVEGATGTVAIHHATVRDNGHRGIEIVGSGDVELSKLNVSGDGSRDGVKVEEAENVTVLDSRFVGNDDGLDLELIATAIVIDNVTAMGNADEGLEVDDTGSVMVTDSVFANNGEAGLDLDDVVDIIIDNVTATHNGEHGLQIESQDDGDVFLAIESVVISNSVFSNNVGDGIQIVAEGDATVDQVSISNVRANGNVEIDDEDGGHGLFIEIGDGTISLENVKTKNNPRGNQLP